MNDQDRTRPIATGDEIDRTGRDAQVTGCEPKAVPGAAATAPGLDDDDAPEGGIDSADFPGTAAP